MQTNEKIEKIIEKAIEGGWQPVADDLAPKYFLWTKPYKIFVAGRLCSLYFETKVEGAVKESILLHTRDIFCDPLFFQALSKACKWEERQHPYWRLHILKEYDSIPMNQSEVFDKRLHAYEAYALRFHELNLSDPINGWSLAIDYLFDLINR